MYFEGIEETIAAAEGNREQSSLRRGSTSTGSTLSATDSENEQRTISFAVEDEFIPSTCYAVEPSSRQRWYSRQDITRMRKRAAKVLKGCTKSLLQKDLMRKNVRSAVLREQKKLKETSERSSAALAAVSTAVTAVSKARALLEAEKAAASARRIFADSTHSADNCDD